MKIARVSAYGVAYPEPNDNGNERCLVFCRVDTADGTTGWGEAVTMTRGATFATIALIDEMGGLLLGKSPIENVAIWRGLLRQGWWAGYEGGVAAFALSAVDIALWDLKGKLLGVSVVDLLGGPERTDLPVIASTHAFLADIDHEAARHARYVVDLGYRGVKIGMGKRGDARLGVDFDRDVSYVRSIREAIGDGSLLIMDRGQSLRWTVADAIRRARAFEEHDLYWIEEPLEPHELEGFRRLRVQSACLVGTGEREWTAAGFARVISSGIADVVGCDPGRAGGISGAMKVIAQVEQAQVWFNAHAWSGAIVTAASLALSASTDRCLVMEMKPVPSPMQHELVAHPFEPVGGVIAVPRVPGLGVEVVERTLATYRLT